MLRPKRSGKINNDLKWPGHFKITIIHEVILESDELSFLTLFFLCFARYSQPNSFLCHSIINIYLIAKIHAENTRISVNMCFMKNKK